MLAGPIGARRLTRNAPAGLLLRDEGQALAGPLLVKAKEGNTWTLYGLLTEPNYALNGKIRGHAVQRKILDQIVRLLLSRIGFESEGQRPGLIRNSDLDHRSRHCLAGCKPDDGKGNIPYFNRDKMNRYDDPMQVYGVLYLNFDLNTPMCTTTWKSMGKIRRDFLSIPKQLPGKLHCPV